MRDREEPRENMNMKSVRYSKSMSSIKSIRSVCALVAGLVVGTGSWAFATPRVVEVNRYPIEFSKAIERTLASDTHQVLGSGLSFRKHGRKKLEFYTVSDKKFRYKKGKDGAPPYLGVLTLKGEKALIDRVVPVYPDEEGTEAVDFEGVATSRKKNEVWLADEEQPSLLRVDAEKGIVRERVLPEGLSPVLGSIQKGRGFEGITVMPDGDVVAVLQSEIQRKEVTDDGVSLKESGFEKDVIRLYRYSPETKRTRVYFYEPTVRARESHERKMGGTSGD